MDPFARLLAQCGYLAWCEAKIAPTDAESRRLRVLSDRMAYRAATLGIPERDPWSLFDADPTIPDT